MRTTRRFVRTARGSLNEVKHFLRRAYRRKLLKEADVKALKALIDELGPKLNNFIKSIGPRRIPSTVTDRPLTTDHCPLTTAH
jgi:four helix bundle protein